MERSEDWNAMFVKWFGMHGVRENGELQVLDMDSSGSSNWGRWRCGCVSNRECCHGYANGENTRDASVGMCG